MAYRLADADQLDGVAGSWRDGPNCVARSQEPALQRHGGQRRTDFRKRHGEARLGQPIDGEHDVGSEARGRERRRKLAAEIGGDRLGAVEDDTDRREVELRRLGRIVRLQVVHIAEVRRTGDRHPVFADLGQPQAGPPHEERRRHQPVFGASDHRHQVKADESHVVRQRHPRQAGIRRCGADTRTNGVDVGHQVAVREHYALGLAGRAGRILDESDVVGRGGDRRAGLGDVGDFVHEHDMPVEAAKGVRHVVGKGKGLEAVEHLALGG